MSHGQDLCQGRSFFPERRFPTRDIKTHRNLRSNEGVIKRAYEYLANTPSNLFWRSHFIHWERKTGRQRSKRWRLKADLSMISFDDLLTWEQREREIIDHKQGCFSKSFLCGLRSTYVSTFHDLCYYSASFSLLRHMRMFCLSLSCSRRKKFVRR